MSGPVGMNEYGGIWNNRKVEIYRGLLLIICNTIDFECGFDCGDTYWSGKMNQWRGYTVVCVDFDVVVRVLSWAEECWNCVVFLILYMNACTRVVVVIVVVFDVQIRENGYCAWVKWVLCYYYDYYYYYYYILL